MEETNLEKARRLYPKGTKFISIFGQEGISSGVFRYSNFENVKESIICIINDSLDLVVYSSSIYKWAEIIEEKEIQFDLPKKEDVVEYVNGEEVELDDPDIKEWVKGLYISKHPTGFNVVEYSEECILQVVPDDMIRKLQPVKQSEINLDDYKNQMINELDKIVALKDPDHKTIKTSKDSIIMYLISKISELQFEVNKLKEKV